VADVEKLRPLLASPDGDFRIEPGGRVQLDYHAVDDDARALTGPELADRSWFRARLDLSGRAFRWMDRFQDRSRLHRGRQPEGRRTVRIFGRPVEVTFAVGSTTDDDKILR
jgi:hypothetical protein